MANLVKIVGKMLEIPLDMRFKEVDVVLRAFGFTTKQTSGSSHFVYRKQCCHPITVPKGNNKVKRCYIIKIIDLLNLEEWYEKRSH